MTDDTDSPGGQPPRGERPGDRRVADRTGVTRPDDGTGTGPGPARRRGRFFRRVPMDRPARRYGQLLAGLFLVAVSLALQIRAQLGLGPWDVFHIGVTHWLPVSIGTVSILTALGVLTGWIPLKERPGPGTLANAVLVGVFLDGCLAWLPDFRRAGDPLTPSALLVPAVALIAGVVVNALAGALYIGAGLGPGPRDGLMTGLVRVTGGKVAYIRGAIELTVLAIGWLLGGPVGVGTVLYAVAIGPLLHLMMPWFALDRADGDPGGPDQDDGRDVAMTDPMPEAR